MKIHIFFRSCHVPIFKKLNPQSIFSDELSSRSKVCSQLVQTWHSALSCTLYQHILGACSRIGT